MWVKWYVNALIQIFFKHFKISHPFKCCNERKVLALTSELENEIIKREKKIVFI